MSLHSVGPKAEFERAIITRRIVAGQARARSKGVRFGRPPVAPMRLEKVRTGLANGGSIRAVAQAAGVSTAIPQRHSRTTEATEISIYDNEHSIIPITLHAGGCGIRPNATAPGNRAPNTKTYFHPGRDLYVKSTLIFLLDMPRSNLICH